MAIPLAAKIVGAGALASSIPVSYLVLDKFLFLNKVEKSVLEENVTLSIVEEDTGAKVTATTTVKVTDSTDTSSVYKWECKIIADGVNASNKGKLKTYLEGKLPVTTSATDEKAKKAENKEKLVWECSKDRKDLDSSSNTYKTELKLKVINPSDETNSPISTDLFGPKESTPSA